MLLHGYSDRLSKGLNRPDALRSEQEYWKTMEPYPPRRQCEIERMAQVIAGARRNVT